ncbi:hypothetical protein [Aquirufa ecclesiirivi]|uniref:hypothetical protein n=1 Tax=Aquirufa ecclesiirivi TaxID=2715124 RepID=UPI0022A86C8B|nr:hypothetical protein [Aquirufa ecclesiirivi]
MNTIGFLSFEPWYILEETPIAKDILFFDRLIFSSASIESADLICSNLPLRPCDKNLVKRKLEEIEKYMNAGLIFDYSANDFKKDYAIFHSIDEAKELGQYMFNSDFDNPYLDKNNPKDNLFGSLSSLREIVELKSRIFSIINNSKSSDLYIPIIREKYKKTLITEKLDISDVVGVVLKKFPIIKEDISVENIIEFKIDPDTKIKLSRLRNWITEISKTSMSVKEMEEKLEYLLLEYSNHMNLHRIEYHIGNFETLVTASLSFIENIAKLKLSKASKVIFDLNRTELRLLKAENDAPGKEVAFINKLNEIAINNSN